MSKKTLKEWRSFFIVQKLTPAEELTESLAEKVARSACIDIQEIIDIAESEISTLQEKGYSWCNRCGCLVVGDINHPCDKCGNHDLEHFVVDVELLRLQALLRWIPVSERLPEHDRQVWICYEKTGYTYNAYYDTIYKMWSIFDYSGGHKWAEDLPTHWREIDLPTGKDSGEGK